jgi:hypothetical protein
MTDLILTVVLDSMQSFGIFSHGVMMTYTDTLNLRHSNGYLPEVALNCAARFFNFSRGVKAKGLF